MPSIFPSASMTAAVLWYRPLARLSKSEAITTTPRFFASFPRASVLGPGIVSASLKFSWSSLWQKYRERHTSCVRMMWAPSREAFSARARVFPRVAAGSPEQACWRSPRVTLPIPGAERTAWVRCDALRPERLELRQDLPHDALVDDRLQGDPFRVAQRGNRRVSQGGDRRDDGVERPLRRVHLEAHLRLGL